MMNKNKNKTEFKKLFGIKIVVRVFISTIEVVCWCLCFTLSLMEFVVKPLHFSIHPSI